MKTMKFVLAGLGFVAAAAGAQEWPEDMARPETYPWETLWPLNNPDDVTMLVLSDAQKKAFNDYTDFAMERHASGMARPFHREGDYRPELNGYGILQRISEMNVGDVETWKGKGYNGQFKLVGAELVGPHTCRQVEWTMSNPTNVIRGNAAGKAVAYRLYCLNPKNEKWFEVR
ncbi:hypothetical protein IC614_04075 [Allosphingosinicella flava]|uniref:Uncharacterized protein n=1 Tax=Allosphingosinicella flava TaxID=2771430 RepID=A0A7T2GKY7_9SPHN|nr:hypothetical protein [Sphingosinicella flava]QPQ55775.1 hypothetical protein IC614_04075 [Sphingosinicella flava]